MQSGPGHLPVWLAAVLLASGMFFSVTLDRGVGQPASPAATGSALDLPIFRIEHRSGYLSIAGTTVSAGHESALLQVIEDQFAAPEKRIELRPGIVLPDDWETASLRLLHALAATQSGTAHMDADRIVIRAVTSDDDALASRLRFLREGMTRDIEIEDDVIVVEPTESLVELCRRTLTDAISETVEFRESSAELRTSSYATLDKVIDVANDCRSSRIAITGHTDASGNEAWNRRLSFARAQAVADYLVRGGIEPARLTVDGAGSSVPVADNSTQQGRSKNRRIEFELQ